MEKTREDLLHCNHFVHINMNGGSLSNKVNTNDEGVVARFSEQLPTEACQRTTYHLNPRPFDEIVVGLKWPLTLDQLFERRHFLVRNDFGHVDPNDPDHTRHLQNRQTARQ